MDKQMLNDLWIMLKYAILHMIILSVCLYSLGMTLEKAILFSVIYIFSACLFLWFMIRPICDKDK